MKRSRPAAVARFAVCTFLSLALGMSCVPCAAVPALAASTASSATESSTSTTTIFETLSTVASWKKANGTSSYTLGSKKVAVSGVKRVGIDVSKWQGTITWKKVAAAGIDYAIIRCGFGSNNTKNDDAYFAKNVSGAQSVGIDIGVYLYSYATTIAAARSEAKHVLRMLKSAGLDPNLLDLPVFMDVEDSCQASLSNAQIGKVVKAFCTVIENNGYTVGVYSSSSWWASKFTASCFQTQGWYRWVARWPTSKSVVSSGVTSTAMWQFTSKGTVSGISGNVDVNFEYNGSGTYSMLRAESAGYNRVKLTWTRASDAARYNIQRKIVGGTFETVKTLAKTTWTDTGLTCGTTYRWRIRAVHDDDGEVTYSSWYKTLSAVPKPGVAGITSLSMGQTTRDVTVKWRSVGGATGYEVWRARSGEKSSKVKSTSQTSWTNTSRALGQTYRYKVRAWRKVGSKKVYGSFSSVKAVTVRPGRVVVSSAVGKKSGSLTVKWGAVKGAGSYEVRVARSGGHVLVKSVTSHSATITGLVSGKRSVKVRAVKRKGSRTYRGPWSKAVSVKVG